MDHTRQHNSSDANSETESIQRSPRDPTLPPMLDDLLGEMRDKEVLIPLEDFGGLEGYEKLRKNMRPRPAPKGTAPGMYPQMINLYEGPPRCNCCTNWIEEYPDDAKNKWEDNIQSYALLVLNKKGHEGNKPMIIDSIVVQSPLLKPVLEEVFEGIEGVTATLKNLIFRKPFSPFFYRWDRFKQAAERHEDPELSHLQLLYELIDGELHETINTYHDLLAHKVMTYDVLWTIFKPGDVLFSMQDDQEIMLKLQNAKYIVEKNKEPYFALSSKFIDWDGFEFGFASSTASITSFEGTKPISQLDIYPAKFHPEFDKVKERVLNRGIRFEALQGYHFKDYGGLVIEHDNLFTRVFEFPPHKSTCESRVVIDAELFYRTHPGALRTLEPLKGTSFSTRLPKMSGYRYVCNPRYDFERVEGEYENEFQSPCGGGYEFEDALGSGATREPKERRRDKPRLELNEEQRLLCSPFIRGYFLKAKMWGHLLVDGVKDITWNNNAFKSLVLPEGYKDLVLSFTRSQNTNRHVFDDVIEGKGKGIIFLLCGDTGVGKTLTAEAVAEHLKVPLYSVSAAELGDYSAAVEESFRKILEMTARWKAVLLLDESDVFLEQRTADNLTRNKIVSIFLRMLEYYRGVLFMTTNRASVLDTAIESRIHVRLNYPELDVASRKQVWQNFIGLLPPDSVKLTEADLATLAELRMNGRQIKNVIKTAELLSTEQQRPLGFAQIETVLRISQAGVDLQPLSVLAT